MFRQIAQPSKSGLLGVLTFTLFLAAYLPALRLLFGIYVNSEEYSHAFMTLPIIFYMVWTRKEKLLPVSDKYTLYGFGLAFLSTTFYLFSLLTQVQSLIFLSLILTIFGTTIYLYGFHAIGTLFTPFVLLLLLIPVPEQLYTQLTFPLQLLVSQSSELLIRLLDIPLLRQGNVMHLPNRSFEVVEACSGLRSIITLLNLSVIMGYFMLRRNGSKTLLFAASIPIAIFVNIVRIVSMILAYHYFQLNLTEGSPHTISGLLVFGLAIFIFFLLQRMLERWESKEK